MSSPESRLQKVDAKEDPSVPEVVPEAQEAAAQPVEKQPAVAPEAAGAKPEESKEKEKALRARVGAAADSLQIFVTQISLREKNGMDTFMTSATRAKLEENIGALRTLASSGEPIDQGQVDQILAGVTDSFAAFSRQPRSGPLRENPKSLMNVAESLKRLYQGVKAFKDAEGASGQGVDTLLEQIEKKYKFMGALHASANDYLR